MGQTSKHVDITKTGREGFRMLQEQNRPDYERLEAEGMGEVADLLHGLRANGDAYRDAMLNPAYQRQGERVESPLARTETPLGASMFDRSQYNAEELEGAGDIRAEDQPWYAKVGAGIGKAAVLAGTTYMQLPMMLLGAMTGQNVVDNTFTRALKTINDASERWMPNYYTEAEQNTPWWSKLGTANFIGDNLIKNMGFMVGAMGSGSYVSGLVRASRIPQLVGNIARAMGSEAAAAAPGVTTSLLASGMMALAEGGVEGINNSSEWADAERERLTAKFYGDLAELNGRYDPNSDEYAIERAKLWRDYNGALGRIADGAKRMGNADLAMNIPILTLSNLIQFGRFLGGGYRTNRMVSNIIRTADMPSVAESSGRTGFGKKIGSLFRGGKGAGEAAGGAGKAVAGAGKGAVRAAEAGADAMEGASAVSRALRGWYKTTRTWKGAVGAGVADVLAEGDEELAQRIAQEIAGRRYEYDLDEFYAGQFDEYGQKAVDDWARAFTTGLFDTLKDPDAWEEWFVGGLFGFMGVPQFRGMHDAQGRIQSPVTMAGGVYGAIRDYSDETRRQRGIADRLNAFMRDPGRLNYYRGLTRHAALDRRMDEAAAKGDILEYKNGEFAQLLSDVMMFDNAGKINDLMEYIRTATATDDANLRAISELTTKKVKGADGREVSVGPFVTESGVPLYEASTDGRGEMARRIEESRDAIFKTIDTYRRVKNDIDIRTGEALSDDQVEQLAYYRMAAMDQRDRAVRMAGELRPKIKEARDFYSSTLDALERETRRMDEEGSLDGKTRESRENTAEKLRSYKEGLDLLVNTGSDEALVAMLVASPEFQANVQGMIAQWLNENVRDDDEFINGLKDTLDKLSDMNALLQISSRFSEAYNAFIDNPGLLRDEMDGVLKGMRERQVAEMAGEVRSRLDAAGGDLDFYNELDRVPDGAVRERVIADLKAADSERLKKYEDRRGYIDAVVKRIQSAHHVGQSVKDAARRIFEKRVSGSAETEAIANPHTVAISRDDLSDPDMSRGKSLLIRVLKDLNESERFRERFGKVRWEDPHLKAKPDPKRPDRDGVETGKDAVPVVKPVEPAPKGTFEPTPTAANDAPPERAESPALETAAQAAVPEIVEARNEGGETEGADEPALPEGEQRGYYTRALPEFKKGTQTELDVALEAEGNGLDVSGLYRFLSANGAFQFVNRGQVKAGAPVGFMIDPAFPGTVFITYGESQQIIGSLFEDETKMSQYRGLKELVTAIREEYAARPEGQTGRFVSKYRSRVSDVYNGKVRVGDREHDAAELFVKHNGRLRFVGAYGGEPLFAIVNKDGGFSVAGAVDVNSIRMATDVRAERSPGSVVLLIPDATGGYVPMVMHVMHFEEGGLTIDEDGPYGSSPVVTDLRETIKSIAESASANDMKGFNTAVGKLKEILSFKASGRRVVGDDYADYYLHIDRTRGGSGHGPSIKLSFAKLDRASGKELYDEHNRRVEKTVFIPLDGGNVAGRLADELMGLHLTYNVSEFLINDEETGYNDRIISSGVLMTNVLEGEVRGSHFHIDWVDANGEAHRAESSPAVTKPGANPMGGPDSAAAGIPVSLGGASYRVDVGTGRIYNEDGTVHRAKRNRQLILDLAWAQSVYGDAMNGEGMIGGVVLTPDGRVLNRNTGAYLGNKAAERFRRRLRGEEAGPDADETLRSVAENQKRVDKGRTDSSFYYIMEEDGKYHRYSRVHSEIEANTPEEESDRRALQRICDALLAAEDTGEFRTMLADLTEETGYDFAGEFSGRTNDVETCYEIRGIMKSIYDARADRNTAATGLGTQVDTIVRGYFTRADGDPMPERPDCMSHEAYDELVSRLDDLSARLKERGERFYANNVVVFRKYEDGRRVAGELDILAVDAGGNFKIYDVKTSGVSFHDMETERGKVNFFRTKAEGPEFTQNRSTFEQYSMQLSAYKDLFESQYGVPVVSMGILPVRLHKNAVPRIDEETGEEFARNTYIDSLEVEVGIPIPYIDDVLSATVARNGGAEENAADGTGTDKTDTASKKDHGSAIFNPLCETMCTADLTDGLFDGIKLGEIVTNGFRYGYFVDGDGEVKRALVHKVDEARGIWLAVVNTGSETDGAQKWIGILTLNGNGKIVSQYDTIEERWKEIATDERRLNSELEGLVKRFDIEVEDGVLDEGVLGERTVLNTLDYAPKSETSMSDVEGEVEPDVREEDNADRDAEAKVDLRDGIVVTDTNLTMFNPMTEMLQPVDYTIGLPSKFARSELVANGFRLGVFVPYSDKAAYKKGYLRKTRYKGVWCSVTCNELGEIYVGVVNSNGIEMYSVRKNFAAPNVLQFVIDLDNEIDNVVKKARLSLERLNEKGPLNNLDSSGGSTLVYNGEDTAEKGNGAKIMKQEQELKRSDRADNIDTGNVAQGKYGTLNMNPQMTAALTYKDLSVTAKESLKEDGYDGETFDGLPQEIKEGYDDCYGG